MLTDCPVPGTITRPELNTTFASYTPIVFGHATSAFDDVAPEAVALLCTNPVVDPATRIEMRASLPVPAMTNVVAVATGVQFSEVVGKF